MSEIRRLWSTFAPLAAMCVLTTPDLAWAAGKDEKAAQFMLAVWAVALFLYPVGLAFHVLIASFAPRRAIVLVQRTEAHVGKTLLLGVINGFALVVLGGFLGEALHPVFGLLAFLMLIMLAFVGSHGLARTLGARALGYPKGEHPPAPEDLKCLALGWFVMLFAAAFPLLGLVLASYWGVRGIGAVVLALSAVPSELGEAGSVTSSGAAETAGPDLSQDEAAPPPLG